MGNDPFYHKPIANVDIRPPLVERKLCIGLIMDYFCAIFYIISII
jgi:hypothetical protein